MKTRRAGRPDIWLARRNELRHYLCAGMTYREIAKVYGVSNQRVHQVCKELGLCTLHRSQDINRAGRNLTNHIPVDSHSVSRCHCCKSFFFKDEMSSSKFICIPCNRAKSKQYYHTVKKHGERNLAERDTKEVG